MDSYDYLILLLILCLSLNQISAQLLENLRLGLESNMAWYNDDKKTGPFFDDVNNDGDKHIRVNSYLNNLDIAPKTRK